MHVSEQLNANTRPLQVNGSNEWQEWPVAAQAKVRLGLTQAQLNQLIATGRLIRWSCPDGKLRFSADDIEELSEEVQTEAKQREQIQTAKERETELSSVLSRAVSLLKVSHDHIESMFKLVSSPIERGTTFLLTINRQQSEEIAHLRSQHEEMFRTREELLSAAHDRELKARKVELAGQNVKHAIDQITTAIGPIAGQVLSNLGLAGLAGKAHPGLELLQTIDPAMLNSLIQLGMLTPAQVKLCREIWPDLEWPEPPPPAPPAQASPEPPPAPPPPPPSATNDRAPRPRRTRTRSKKQ